MYRKKLKRMLVRVMESGPVNNSESASMLMNTYDVSTLWLRCSRMTYFTRLDTKTNSDLTI